MPNDQSILLSALPPTRGQIQIAAFVAFLLFGGLLATIPFMDAQLRPVEPFIPIVDFPPSL